MTEPVIAILTIIFLICGAIVVVRLANGKFEKIGYSIMFSLAIAGVFMGGVLDSF